jgi:hypothetical protein
MSIRVFRLVHPLTDQVFRLTAEFRPTRAIWPDAWLSSIAMTLDNPNRFVGRFTLAEVFHADKYLRIHSHIEPEWRQQGLGVLGYLASARIAGLMHYRGLYSPHSSDAARRVWQRLHENGIAKYDINGYFLDAKAARPYVKLQYLGKLGAPLRHGATW